MKSRSAFAIAGVLFATGGMAAELVVQAGGIASLEEAVARAAPGDTIVVRVASLDRVAVRVTQPRVTIRADGTNRVALHGEGFDYSGRGPVPRAIVQFDPGADGCTLEGFALSGAHNESHNGAGVRINQANDVTIRNCEIHGNDMGIMSGGDGTTNTARGQTIVSCEIHHNGDRADPGYNHNLYLGGTAVTVRDCDIHHSLTGHNLKSRAHRITVTGCHIHDSANREVDLVDAADTERPGSDALIEGCTIVKDPACAGNRGVIHFGKDVGRSRDGQLVLRGNTIRTPFVSPVVTLSSPRTRVVLERNRIENTGHQRSGQILVDAKASTESSPVTGSQNTLAPSFDASGLKD